MAKAWDGSELLPCKQCGEDAWEHLDDVDHDGGSCQVFRCSSCARTIHIELPD